MGALIRTVPDKGRILFAVEELDGDKRYMRVRRMLPDGTTWDELQEAVNTGPLLNIMGLGDVDDIALRDIVQMVKATPPPEREDKPDITQLYLDFQEGRRMEMSGRRHYGMWPRKRES